MFRTHPLSLHGFTHRVSYASFVALAIVVTTLCSGAEVREWVSADGNFKVQASLVDYTDTSVRLRKTADQIVDVPVDKISDADKEYLRANPSNVYRVDGVFRIQNASAQYGWFTQEVTSEGQTAHLLTCGETLETSDSVVQVVRQPLERDFNEARRNAIAAIATEESVKGFRELFPDFDGRLEVREDGERKKYVMRATFSTAMGEKVELRTRYRFTSSAVYHVTAMASSAREAEKLVEVAETIEEISQ